jgi:hypothetical protein
MRHLKEYENFDDLGSLHNDMRNLGLSLTQEEERMLKFIHEFGGGKDAEEFAEYLEDYYWNPEEYDIDRESEYYDAIADYFEEIEDCANFDLKGPMKMSMTSRWNLGCIERSECYGVYKKMSTYQ